LLSPMLEAARTVRAASPGVEFAMAEASPVFRDRLAAAVASSGLPVAIVPGSRDVMAASTVLLMASGTAAVEAMILGVPMVVTYRVSRPTWWYARAAFNVRWVSIPNIMAGEQIVPELLQGQATAGEMSRAILALLHDASAREAISHRLRSLAEGLGSPGAARRAAAEVLSAASGLERPLSRPVR
ncbi:MAG: lipid-A-disaccharide synthase, partial [bacterium]|nr:lipid-A-disaccharide synthase [bacterium]